MSKQARISFSDQTYRHRRNLLILSTFILACAFSGAVATSLPYGIYFTNSILHTNWILILSIAYFLIIFWVSATAEFKSRVDDTVDNDETPYVMSLPDTDSGRAKAAYATLCEINQRHHQNFPPNEEQLERLAEQLECYATYQNSIWKYWEIKFFMDFWLPILLGVLAIGSLCYLHYCGENFLPINSNSFPLSNIMEHFLV